MPTVKLLVRKGTNPVGSFVEYDDASAEWMVRNGYGTLVPVAATPSEPQAQEEDAPAPRRGRPRKADKS